MGAIAPIRFTAVGGELGIRLPFPSMPASVLVNGSPVVCTLVGDYLTYPAALTAGDVVNIAPSASDLSSDADAGALPIDTTPNVRLFTATIASGQSLSNAIDLQGFTLRGIIMPASWNAADLSFLAGPDVNTLNSLHNSTTTSSIETVVKVTTSRMYMVDRTYPWEIVRAIQLRSGTLATPVPQGAARAITLIGVK